MPNTYKNHIIKVHVRPVAVEQDSTKYAVY